MCSSDLDPWEIEERTAVAWIGGTVAAVVAVAVVCAIVTTRGSMLLPAIMSGNGETAAMLPVVTTVWIVSLAVLALLLLRRPYTGLDLWLMVVLVAWVLDVALAAVLNAARFDVGYYAGRIYGLMAASSLLVVMLLENNALYMRLGRALRVAASARARADNYAEHLQTEVAASEERYRRFIERATDAVFVLTGDGTILEANPAAVGMLGGKELRGQLLHTLLGRTDAADLASGLLTFEHGVPRRPKTLDISLSEVPGPDGASRLLIARDVTEQISLQAQFHQAQKMESLGQLTGGMAHDFNNLLTVIIGNLELMLDDGSFDADTKNMAQRALRAAHNGAALTKSLLAFARKQSLAPSPLDVNELVAGLSDLLRRTLGEHIKFQTLPGKHLWHAVADAAQVESAIANLAINARDAMPDGGTLHITTGVVDVTQTYNQMPPGRYVEIKVADTGTGMKPDILQHIFEPFFTTKGSGGTGLGLASVYGIVKQTGGFIWCHSTPGEGTTFTIYFRPAKGAAVAPQAPDAMTAPVAGGTETVLVVDDERGVRLLLTQILRNRGYTVIPAADAKTALEALGAPDQQIDLVVSDIVLQGMSGTRLVEEIQLRWPTMKLLLVSGYSRGVALPPGSGAGKVPLLGKPFTPKRLEAIVRDILDGVEVRRMPARAPEELPEP